MIVPILFIPLIFEVYAFIFIGLWFLLQISGGMLLQDADGQIQETHSVSAGLDYPGVGPEHALLLACGRVQYETASDAEALEAVRECCECEGILPALESAHALAGARRWASAHAASSCSNPRRSSISTVSAPGCRTTASAR